MKDIHEILRIQAELERGINVICSGECSKERVVRGLASFLPEPRDIFSVEGPYLSKSESEQISDALVSGKTVIVCTADDGDFGRTLADQAPGSLWESQGWLRPQ